MCLANQARDGHSAADVYWTSLREQLLRFDMANNDGASLRTNLGSRSSTVQMHVHIIHNTWKTKDLPPEWQFAREQCMKAHPGYEFMLWTDESARAMVAKVGCTRTSPPLRKFVLQRGFELPPVPLKMAA